MIDKILSKKALIITGYAIIGLILLASSYGFIYSPDLNDHDAQGDKYLLKANFIISILAFILYSINIGIRKNYPEFESFKKYYIIHWFLVSVPVILPVMLLFPPIAFLLLPTMILLPIIALIFFRNKISDITNNDIVYYSLMIVRILMFYLFWNIVICGFIT